MDGPFVSVIVPVHNDAERLARCLEALDRQSYPADRYEVVVVDNDSEQPIEAVVHPFRQARAIFEGRRGSYAARNAGIEAAAGSLLAFTDADCVPARTWLAEGARALAGESDGRVAGGRIELFFQDPEQLTAAERYEQVTAFDQRHYIQNGHYGATANLFAPRAAFESVGRFNASLRSGGDHEWGNRAHEAGYDLHYAARAVVRHPARPSLQALRRKERRVATGQFRFMYQQRSLAEQLARALRHLRPPWHLVLRALDDERLSPVDRLKVVGVEGALRWTRFQTYLTLILRGPRNDG